MRRIFILLLTICLASGTIAGSIAHATEGGEDVRWSSVATDAGCLAAPVTDAAEPEEQSSPGDQKQAPSAPHGCHGHHSSVAVEIAAPSSDVSFSQLHARVMASTLPPAAYIGTFRPPIA